MLKTRTRLQVDSAPALPDNLFRYIPTTRKLSIHFAMALVPINNFRDWYSMDFRYTGQNTAVLFWRFNLQHPEEPIPIFILNNSRAPPNPNAPPGTHNGYITTFSEVQPQTMQPGFLAARVRWWPNAMYPPQLQVRHGGHIIPHTMEDLVPLRSGVPGTLRYESQRFFLLTNSCTDSCF